MSVRDEFHSLPPEDIMPKEDLYFRKREENERVIAAVKHVVQSEESEHKENIKKNTLLKMFAGAVVSAMVITNVEGEDIFWRTHELEDYSVIRDLDYEWDNSFAAYIEDDGSICLTDGDKTNCVGIISSKEPIDLSEKLTLEFEVYQSEKRDKSNGYGADGMSVSFSNAKNDTGTRIGGYLGYNGEFGVEFDLVENPDGEVVGGEDYPDDHIAILGKTVWQSYSHTDKMSLDDGKWHKVKIIYDDLKLTVYYDKDKILSSTVINASDKMYLSVAGACGDGTVYQAVKNLKLNGKAVSVSSGSVYEHTDVVSDITETEKDVDNSLSADTSATEPEDANTKESENTENISSTETDTETDDSATETFVMTVTCSTCNGYGIICPGSVEADDPEGCHGVDMVDCKACDGTGYEADGVTLCGWCKGTLKHRCPSFEYHYECPDCNGTGNVDVTITRE